jgi:hypothetical protein
MEMMMTIKQTMYQRRRARGVGHPTVTAGITTMIARLDPPPPRLTEMPNGCSSRRRASEMASTAYLDAEYTPPLADAI